MNDEPLKINYRNYEWDREFVFKIEDTLLYGEKIELDNKIRN